MASISVPLLISVTEYLTNNLKEYELILVQVQQIQSLSLGNMFWGLQLDRISRQWNHVEGEASLGRQSIYTKAAIGRGQGKRQHPQVCS